jgi:ubiquitin C-terminal hydrolase
MAAEQNCCSEMQCLLGGSSLSIAFQQAGTHRLGGDFSFGGTGKIQERHFFHLHNISQPGRLASRRLVSSRYVWRGLAQGVAA